MRFSILALGAGAMLALIQQNARPSSRCRACAAFFLAPAGESFAHSMNKRGRTGDSFKTEVSNAHIRTETLLRRMRKGPCKAYGKHVKKAAVLTVRKTRRNCAGSRKARHHHRRSVTNVCSLIKNLSQMKRSRTTQSQLNERNGHEDTFPCIQSRVARRGTGSHSCWLRASRCRSELRR